MKKYLLLLTLAAACTINANAQEEKENKKYVKAPAAVSESFKKQFPGVTAKWEKEDDKYEASFKQNGKEMSALFETNGTMTESEVEIKIAELPAAATSYLKEHYKGVTIKEATKITKANGEVNYEAEVKGKDVLFDTAGKFLKEVKD